METRRIAELFAEMSDPEEGVNNFIMSALIDQMVGRSLEAAIPILERAHDALAASGEVSLPSGIRARVLDCPEGPHGGVWRKAFILEGPGKPLLTVLEVDGEPDPKLDELLDAMLAKSGKTPVKREPRRGPCDAVRVFAPKRMDGVAACLAADARDDWHSDKALETRKTLSPFEKGETWNEFRNSVVSGPGLDAWQPYFAGMRELIGTLGLSDEMAASAGEIAGRNWAEHETSADYRAARAFGTEAAHEDGCLPGPACAAALGTLDRLAAEAAMSALAPEIHRLIELLPTVGDDHGRFDCNDGRNEARLESHEGDGFRLVLADQNGRFVVSRESGTETIGVTGQRGGGLREAGRTAFEVSFDPGPGGWAMTGEIGLSADAIRAWNSFKSGVATLSLCATEDAEASARPAGPR